MHPTAMYCIIMEYMEWVQCSREEFKNKWSLYLDGRAIQIFSIAHSIAPVPLVKKMSNKIEEIKRGADK